MIDVIPIAKVWHSKGKVRFLLALYERKKSLGGGTISYRIIAPGRDHIQEEKRETLRW